MKSSSPMNRHTRQNPSKKHGKPRTLKDVMEDAKGGAYNYGTAGAGGVVAPALRIAG